MIKTAIIEDDENAYQLLKEYLTQFGKENSLSFETYHYGDGLSFLDEYQPMNLVFMDIELPFMNGMEVATKLRAIDENVVLIFITNMAQFAIQGYSVDALDYVLKPIRYSRFSSLMKKTMRFLGEIADQEVVLKTTGGMRKIYLSSIYYIEISDHLLIYHTDKGDVEVWGTLSAVEKQLPKETFCRCSHSVIVNLKYVTSTDKDTLFVTEKNIPLSISHSKKKDFIQRLDRFMGL